ncbi:MULTISPECIES: hypothetical protein [unclassified Aminobacter]|jgi:hypothetical protein|uniref:hypothetical protein n=1 Tax=unclassified Aminobacter TaxID=2644704 RepID=UPI0004659451|nr:MULTISPECIES: hypothetical protein [unclassified Aminobacter]TWG53715.1 hypothetical protein L610_004700000100 [Aminobacter sp. J44]TWH28122.1 hypothetical protein L611_004600000100 [Aminobacter sp. J15]
MLRRVLAPVLLLFLAGCVTAEEQRAMDEDTCRSYGFTKKNDAFAECLLRLELDRRAERRASMAQLEYSRPWVIYRPVPVHPPHPPRPPHRD